MPLAVGLGLLAALYRNSIFDRLISGSTLAAISFPEYFVAYILILVFSVHLGWFPSLANVEPGAAFGHRLYVTFLPAVTLTLIVMAHMMRMTRAAIINLLALRRGRWSAGLLLAEAVLGPLGAVAVYFVILQPLFDALYAAVPALADVPFIGNAALGIAVLAGFLSLLDPLGKLLKILFAGRDMASVKLG